MTSSSGAMSGPEKAAADVFTEMFSRYAPEEVALSFNGGKDSTVVLHVLRRFCEAAAGAAPDTASKSPLSGVRLVYFKDDDEFPEILEFMDTTAKALGTELEVLVGFRDGLQRLVDQGVKAVILGTRRSDPDGVHLSPFSPTSPGWPPVVRVNPILDWSYADVWTFLRSTSCDYCSLYDKGFTSLGSVSTTLPNPELRVAGSGEADGPCEYLPAWQLTDGDLERRGRTKRSTTPAPASSSDAASPGTAKDGEAADTPTASTAATPTTGTAGGGEEEKGDDGPDDAATDAADPGADTRGMSSKARRRRHRRKKKKGGGGGGSGGGGGGGGGDPTAGAGADPPKPALTPQEQFIEELRWCIAQLELGLKRPDCSKDQAKEVNKVLTTLRSTKAPLVKKRQTMRIRFGDVKKLMKEHPVSRDVLDAVKLTK